MACQLHESPIGGAVNIGCFLVPHSKIPAERLQFQKNTASGIEQGYLADAKRVY